MHLRIKGYIFLSYLFICVSLSAQKEITLTNPKTGLRVIVINKEYPLLKILLPGQLASERGIEVEFPEHVTGINGKNNSSEHLYLVTMGTSNKRTPPLWKVEGNTVKYETILNNEIKMTATASLEDNGVRYTYMFFNNSKINYTNLQAVTCVKLYSAFSDTLLQRTYVHHTKGFDLLASETPGRLTMPLSKWLPCRYLVSYSWPVPAKLVQKDEDFITRYNKSQKADKPFIATISHDKKWIAATYTSETGNLWTNPERSCQHADPSISLKAGDTKSLELKTFIFQGELAQLLSHIDREVSGKHLE
jgi:hypothetical protein